MADKTCRPWYSSVVISALLLSGCVRFAGREVESQPAVPEVDRELILAFGQNCKEVDRAIKLQLHTRHLVLACDAATVEEDGRLKLAPLSLVLFRSRPPHGWLSGRDTITSDFAYLTFDRPVVNLTEIGGRKWIAAEFVGNLRLNNRPLKRLPARLERSLLADRP
jgi:hypothetical protein